MLEDAASRAGIEIDRSSIRLTVAPGAQLAAAIPNRIGDASGDVLGMFIAGGRLGGDVPRAGAYVVKLARGGNQRRAALFDISGTQTAVAPIDTRRAPEPIQAALVNGCDGSPIIGKKHICFGFTCCSGITGCISNHVCFTTEGPMV